MVKIFNRFRPSAAWAFLLPKALSTCGEALKRHPETELLFVSGFSRTAATLGYIVHRLYNLPLFLDFSPLSQEDDAIGGRDFSLFGKAEHTLDRHILHATDKILLNSRQARQVYAERFPNLPSERFGVLYDPFGTPHMKGEALGGDERFTLVLEGSFSCEEKANVFKGIRRFLSKEYVPSKRIRLVLTEPLTAETEVLARDMGLESSLHRLSGDEIGEKPSWLNRADALLLGSKDDGPFLPSEWPDSLASGSFLLDLTNNRELRWLVRQSQTGISLSPRSVEDIAVGISQAWTLDRTRFKAERDERLIDTFSAGESTRRLSRIFDETLLRNTRKSGSNPNTAGLRTVL